MIDSNTPKDPTMLADAKRSCIANSETAQDTARAWIDDQRGVVIKGRVVDHQSGMGQDGGAGVECALAANGPWVSATPANAGSRDLSAWQCSLTVPAPGSTTVLVRARDAAGNSSPTAAFTFNAVRDYVPRDLAERLDDRYYLAQLLDFAASHVGDANGPLPIGTVSRVLDQPLERLQAALSVDAVAAAAPINQLRLPVEILRRRLVELSVVPQTGPYILHAYQALLVALGTSFEELERAINASPDERAALANRLGLPLYGLTAAGPRPDQLDTLYLNADQLPAPNEQTLEDLFGLRATETATNQDSLRTIPPPRVLTWQLEAQRNMWQLQDAAAVAVDPDLITAADLQPAGLGAAQARQLLQQRAAQLLTIRNTLRHQQAAPNDPFGRMLQQSRVPLDEIMSSEMLGVDISRALTDAGLDNYGYRSLVEWKRLIADGRINNTSIGWGNVVDVLVGASRRQLYATWSTAETDFSLSPDTFIIQGPDGPDFSRYRVNPQERQDWLDRLRGRTAQRMTLLDSYDGAVSAAERTALPLLRDLLMDAAETVIAGDPAATLNAQYQVDFTAYGSADTTRMTQAIASLQTLLAVVRSGDHVQVEAIMDWRLTEEVDVFDQGWKWMRSAAAWRSVTTTFLFPESMLNPSVVLTNASVAPAEFQDLYDSIKTGLGDPASWTEFTKKLAAFEDAAASYLTSRLSGDHVDVTIRYLPEDGQTRRERQLALNTASAYTYQAGTDGAVREIFWTVPMAIGQALQGQGQFQQALDWYWIALPYNDREAVPAYSVIQTERTTTPPVAPNLDGKVWDVTSQDPFQLTLDPSRPRTAPHLRASLLIIGRCLVDYGDQQFTAETPESLLLARTLYATAIRLLSDPVFTPVTPRTPGEPALQVPTQQSLLLRATTQSQKLRQNRTISGLQRQQADSTAPSATEIQAPTPYHFKILLGRAQQLQQQAANIEGQYLQALEKYDNKSLQESDAQDMLAIAQARVTATTSRQTEAKDSLTAAQDQSSKAKGMVETYQRALARPSNAYEGSLFEQYKHMRGLQDGLVGVDTAIGIAHAASQVDITKPLTFVSAGMDVIGYAAKGMFQAAVNDLQSQIQSTQLNSSIEERRREFARQLAAATADVRICVAQEKAAGDRVTIAENELTVANAEQSHAANTLRMLRTAFTNADLYQWLVQTLGGTYRFFLQQATATARLAQAQLAFERAERAQAFIAADYWNADRKGLTAAERLGGDIARLEQYAFSSDYRRLNVSQTFSLAQVLPIDFREFRETGVLSFVTPMAWFDNDFAGHYLRLIRQVKLSVVALVPPSRGIRGTLSSTGISRVTTNTMGTFAEVTLRRDPTTIALTSPVNATGLFDMDTQPEMLLPFEGNGVDTTWTLALPKAANPIDYSTICDVLLTIEYTARTDPDYESQVKHRLNAATSRTGDCVVSLAEDFPDQWYELHNPADPAAPRTVTLPLRDVDFPPNITSLTSAGLAVHLESSSPQKAVPVTLSHAPLSGTAATDATGTISTRRGATDWIKLVGFDPVGDWQLTFDPSTSALFDDDTLDDVLVNITWAGHAPAWTE